MKKYTCIIVDDEKLARELLVSHISQIQYLEIIAICSNAIEAKRLIENQSPDILFLDIQMPNLSGIDLLRILKYQPATILTTAFSDYALLGYELNVLDYLMKPIEFERFFKALLKATDWLERGQTVVPANLSLSSEVSEASENYFFVKSDYKMVKIIFADILFVEAMQKYVRIFMPSQVITTLLSMSQLEESLPSSQFIRIHRSYIINLAKIDSVEGNMVHIGKHSLPISKGQKDNFLDWLHKKGKI